MMTANATPEEQPADLDRHSGLREWMIDALAQAMGGLAVFYYKPDGFIGGLITFVGAYTLTHSLQGLNWQSLRVISEFLLVLLTLLIHLGTLVMVPATSIQGLVFTFLLPGIAQAYWLWELWPTTGALSHPLTAMCAAWLALLAVWIVAKRMPFEVRAPKEAAKLRRRPLS